MIRPRVTQVPRSGPSPHAADLAFRPPGPLAPRREDEAWQTVIREELVKLRRRSPSGSQVVPASRHADSRPAEGPAADEGPGAPEPSPRAR
jgi:hypothetical protein